MARTKDPHAAAIKSWETRRRSGPVQQRTDYARSFASPSSVSALVSEPDAKGCTHGGEFRFRELTDKDRSSQARTAKRIERGLIGMEIPQMALDGLRGIDVVPGFSFFRSAGAPPRRLAPAAHYLGGESSSDEGFIRLNATYLDGVVRHIGEVDAVRKSAKHVVHEIGHHVYLSKVTAQAAKEWASISDSGNNCKLSPYGRVSQSEHFSEAFAAYCASTETVGYSGFHRANLKALEPEAYAFMERLFSTSSMWLPKGNRNYVGSRAWSLG